MRKGTLIFDEDFAATNSAPSGATDGAPIAVDIGGDSTVSDALAVVCKFTGTGTTASITPYLYFPHTSAAWVSGALYAVKETGDADGGAILDIPAVTGATRIDFHVSALDADGVSIEVYHNEHSEAL